MFETPLLQELTLEEEERVFKNCKSNLSRVCLYYFDPSLCTISFLNYLFIYLESVFLIKTEGGVELESSTKMSNTSDP